MRDESTHAPSGAEARVDRAGGAAVPPPAGTAAFAGGTVARGRIAELADAGSFVEFGALAEHRGTGCSNGLPRPPGDGVVTGVGRVDGRPVALFAQDPRDLGGSVGEVHAAKVVRLLEYALRARTPVVGLVDSGGARIQEGVGALDGYAAIFRATVRNSGRVPQLTVVLGPCAGGGRRRHSAGPGRPASCRPSRPGRARCTTCAPWSPASWTAAASSNCIVGTPAIW